MDVINEYSNIFRGIVANLMLCFLALIAFFDIMDQKGFSFSWYSNRVRIREKERIDYIHKRSMESISHVFAEDYKLLMQHEDERIRSLLVQLGLSRDQFEQIKLEIIKLRKLPMNNWENIKNKLKETCISKIALVDQTNITCKIYDAVNYYINLTDIMFDESFAHDLASMMVGLIEKDLSEEEICQIEKVVVPTDGNYLLGLKVSEKMRIPIVKMRNNSRIKVDQYWDGDFKADEKVIIVHDVLVKADQIEKSIRLFPPNVSVMGLFCLVHRTEWNGEKKLVDRGVKVHSILQICDNDIKEMITCESKNGSVK